MILWKKLGLALLFTLGGLFALIGQYKYTWISWANIASARIYVIAMMAIIALGQSYLRIDPIQRLKFGLLTFAVELVGMFLIGGFGVMQNALTGVDFVGASGNWIAFDTLSTPYTSKALEFAIIVDTIVGIIPTAVLAMGLIGVWTSDSSDEQQTAMIEFGLCLAILLVSGFFGNLIGISFV